MTDSADKPMTKAERDELARLIRQRAKVDRANIDARRAELLADFEQSMATVYDREDAAWRDIWEDAQRQHREIEERLKQRADELGIPHLFRPRAIELWMRRGQNEDPDRRREFRKVAETRLDAMARRAKLRVDEAEVATLGKIVAHGLTTTLAVEFLAAMPQVGELMQPLDRAEIEAAVPMQRPEHRS
jgi:hypothetical protein